MKGISRETDDAIWETIGPNKVWIRENVIDDEIMVIFHSTIYFWYHIFESYSEVQKKKNGH